MAVTAAIVGIAATLASTGYAASEQRDQRRESKDATRDANNKALGLEADAKNQASIKEAQDAAAQAQQEARKRQRASVLSNYGRAGTLLTGPSGLGGNPEPLGT